MVNTPFPCNLKSEAKKAAKILREFSIPSAKNGPDKIIPTGILVHAAGLAVITVAKIGFLVTARGGSGIVIAKLPNGRWSAPSAIGIAGLGGGLELGAEMTDFVIILNSENAVSAFSKGGNLTLGGNFTIAAGPLGRNVEGDIAVRSPAAIYTYSKTRGLFAGISVEGSALIERKDANKKFYGMDIRASEILSGKVEPPFECDQLYNVLEEHSKNLDAMMLEEGKRQVKKQGKAAMEAYGLSETFQSLKSLGPKSKKEEVDGSRESINETYDNTCNENSVKRSSSSHAFQGAEKEHMHSQQQSFYYQQTVTKKMTKSQSATAVPKLGATSAVEHGSNQKMSQVLVESVSAWDQPTMAKADFPFQAQWDCDISFKAGDKIEILTRTATQNDWWEGRLKDKVGIFPANFVTML